VKGLPYESKLLEFSKDEHKTPAYLRLNPRGQSPHSLTSSVDQLKCRDAFQDEPEDSPTRSDSTNDHFVNQRILIGD
jgi:hypothetical protein